MEQETAPGGERRYGHVALLAAFVLTFVLLFATLLPLAAPILLGALLAGFALPTCDRLARRLGGRRWPATIITLGMLVVIIAPLTFLVGLVVDRVVELVNDGQLK